MGSREVAFINRLILYGFNARGADSHCAQQGLVLLAIYNYQTKIFSDSLSVAQLDRATAF